VPDGADALPVVAEWPAASTRKRKHRSQPRKKGVNVRFDDAEFGLIEKAAGRAGVCPTAYVGIAAVAAAAGTEVPGSPIREALGELNQARTAVVRVGVAVNKLAAQALSVGGVTAAQVASATDATRRVVAGLDEVAARVARVLR
jgi:hypothetical protein